MGCLEGRSINLRLVEVFDAEFILSLRMLENKNKHLTRIENDIEKQRDWLQGYKKREAEALEFYFVIEDKAGNDLGLVGIYDLKPDSFCWGSWLLKDGAPKVAAIESALLVYEYGFGELGFEGSHFDVRKGNSRVVDFHLRFGAKIVDEDDENFYFKYKKQDYLLIRKKYKRYLK